MLSLTGAYSRVHVHVHAYLEEESAQSGTHEMILIENAIVKSHGKYIRAIIICYVASRTQTRQQINSTY